MASNGSTLLTTAAAEHAAATTGDGESYMMKAIAVTPGQPNSAHLASLAKPSVAEIANGRGVLVRVLRVGVDGTDKEINAAEYGAAPSGYDFLVIGHEGFGQVEAVLLRSLLLEHNSVVLFLLKGPIYGLAANLLLFGTIPKANFATEP